MKRITQERLIKAINKIDETLTKNTELTRQTEIIKTFSLRGLKSVCGVDTELDNDRLKVELNYWEAPKTKNDFH